MLKLLNLNEILKCDYSNESFEVLITLLGVLGRLMEGEELIIGLSFQSAT